MLSSERAWRGYKRVKGCRQNGVSRTNTAVTLNEIGGGSSAPLAGELANTLHREEMSQPDFKGSSKEPAPQPKAPEPAPRFWLGSLLEEPDFGRFVHHSMPSMAETLFLQLSVSKNVIVFTVNVSIKLDQVARCEGIPQCMLRVVYV